MAYLDELFEQRIDEDGTLADVLLEARQKCQSPKHPGPCAKPGGEEAPAEKPTASKPTAHVFGQREQQHAEANQVKLASALKGAKSIPGNAPSDIEKTTKSVRHQMEMKTLLVNKRGRLKMTPAAMARKMQRLEQHPPPPSVRQWTCCYDNRQEYASDTLDKAPTFPVFIREGVGRYSVGGMHKVESAAELQKLMDTPSDQLPSAARAAAGGFYAKWMSATPEQRTKIAETAFKKEKAVAQKTKDKGKK